MFYDYFETGVIGTITLVGDEDGLRHIVLPEEKKPVLIRAEWKRENGLFSSAKYQLRAYFEGELEQFDLPVWPIGTPFQLRVWHALRKIPYGELVSYKAIAEAIGSPKAFRAVGRANGKNPIPIIIPCHRCIGSNGNLTGFGGGLETKKRLIDLERARPRLKGESRD